MVLIPEAAVGIAPPSADPGAGALLGVKPGAGFIAIAATAAVPITAGIVPGGG